MENMGTAQTGSTGCYHRNYVKIFLLAVAKFIIGYLFESRILIADAYHSGVDVFAIFASWFLVTTRIKEKEHKISLRVVQGRNFCNARHRRKKSEKKTFITWAGIENLLEGYGKLYVPAPEQAFPLLPVMVSGASVVVCF